MSATQDELSAEDLERCAVAAHLLGDDTQVASLLDRAHRGYLDRGMHGNAARCIFWLLFHLRNAGETARAAGWLARLHRILDDHDLGGQLPYLALLADGSSQMMAGVVNEATPLLDRAVAGARAAGDDELFVLAGMARAGLYFLGLEFQYAVASATIQGLDQDARYLLRAMAKQPIAQVVSAPDRVAA